jgi:hypothetical protein
MSGSAPQPSARRFLRHQADVRISVQLFRASESLSFWGRSTELGEDGVGCTLTGEVQVGEVVSMELSLPLSSYPMKFRAIARYRMGLRHGFEFLALNPDQRGTLHRVCELLAASE